MEAVKSWVFAISVAAVVATITEMLIPKGNLEKIVKIVVRVFLLSIIISPILVDTDLKITTNDSFEIKIEDYTQELETEMAEMIETQLSKQIEQMVFSQLAEIDVYPKGVDVLVVADGLNSAEVVSVEVRLTDNYKIKDTDIRYRIRNITECETALVYIKG